MAKIVTLVFDEEINSADVQGLNSDCTSLESKGYTVYSEYSPLASVSTDSGLPRPNRPTRP